MEKEVLRISLIGRMKAEVGQEELSFRSNKIRSLFAYLLMQRGKKHRRDELATLFWGDQDDKSAKMNLRSTLSRLRKSLQEAGERYGCEGLGDWLELEGQTVNLGKAPLPLFVDVWEFDALWSSCEAFPRTEWWQRVRCIEALQKAVVCFQGEFLEGISLEDAPDFVAWYLSERERLHRQGLEALRILASHALATESYGMACEYAQRQLEREAWCEEAYRQWMEALWRGGDTQGALYQFSRCEEALQEHLGASPEPATLRLVERIRRKKLSPSEGIIRPISFVQEGVSLRGLVGRRNEALRLMGYLLDPEHRLVTLCGVGGIGKTRLAQDVLQKVARHFLDGGCFVSLAGRETALEAEEAVLFLASSLAYALDFSFQDNKQVPEEQLLAYLQDKEMLILFDNAEIALEAAPWLRKLLLQAPGVRLFVTSRAPLELQSETVVSLLGLSCPEVESLEGSSFQSWRQYDALVLFSQRAKQIQTDFEMDSKQIADIVSICRFLDGSPLGIELAVSSLGRLRLEDLVREIPRNMELLASKMRDIPSRHRSLRAVFESSWRLLEQKQKQGLALLSLFAGDFSEDADKEIVGVGSAVLSSFVRISLLQSPSIGRFQMHPLLRSFLKEKCISSQDAEDHEDLGLEELYKEAQRCHARWFFGRYLHDAMRYWRAARRQALGECRAALADIQQAWEWALAVGAWELLSPSIEAYGAFFLSMPLFQEGQRVFQEALERCPKRTSINDDNERLCVSVRCLLLIQCAHLLRHQEQTSQAAEVGREAIMLARMLEDTALRAKAVVAVAFALQHQTHFKEIEELLEGLLGDIEEGSLPISEAPCFNLLGYLKMWSGQREEACSCLEKSLALYESMGHLYGVLKVRSDLATVLTDAGKPAEAREQLALGIEVAEAQCEDFLRARLLVRRGVLLSFDDLHETALADFEQARKVFRRLRTHNEDILQTTNMALELLHLGQAERAYNLALEALEQAQRLGNRNSEAMIQTNISLFAHQAGFETEAEEHAEQAVRLSRMLGFQWLEGYALTNLGHALVAQKRWEEGKTAYQKAADLREEMKQPELQMESRAGLARIALYQDDESTAISEAKAIFASLQEGILPSAEEPLRPGLTCAEIFFRYAPTKALPLLEQLYQRLHDKAQRIQDEESRTAFLSQIPTHQAILALWKQHAPIKTPPKKRAHKTR